MANIVTGDQYRQLDGQLAELKHQLHQEEGYPFDPMRLKDALQAVIEGRFDAIGGQFPSIIFAADLIPKDAKGRPWDVVEDVAPSEFDVADLEFLPFLKEGETSISGEEMRQRAVSLKANFGLVDGKRILADQAKIPVEMRSKYIVLSGTKLRDSDDGLRVACLYWLGDRWCLDFTWLVFDWFGVVRLARCK